MKKRSSKDHFHDFSDGNLGNRSVLLGEFMVIESYPSVPQTIVACDSQDAIVANDGSCKKHGTVPLDGGPSQVFQTKERYFLPFHPATYSLEN